MIFVIRYILNTKNLRLLKKLFQSYWNFIYLNFNLIALRLGLSSNVFTALRSKHTYIMLILLFLMSP